MRFTVLNRKIHYWVSALITIPLIIVICSGILLQLKKHWNWVQPKEQWGTTTSPNISIESILASVQGVQELSVSGWDDIKRMDVRPDRGIVKVWLQNGWEVQVDLGSGQVLQAAYRRSDLIESIHDGSFFAGNISKLFIFLPSGILLLLMWITGFILFWRPFIIRSRNANATSKR